MSVDRTIRLRREAWGFAFGSFLFLVGAVPFCAHAVGTTAVNLTFFIGALFFTAAAFIQLALSGRPPPGGTNRADRNDWWAAASAFAVAAYVIPSTVDLVSLFWANLGTLLGAACFLSATLLSRRLPS